MAFLRAFLLIAALASFFVAVLPLQGLALRRPRLAGRLLRILCHGLLRILRVSVEVRGAVAEGGPVLLVANHISWIDILALGSVMPFCFLAKREVASWPLLSTFAKAQGTVFVDRRRRRGVLAANRSMAERMLAGRRVLLFPEGTTLAGAVPGRFLSSHFAAARDLLRLAPGEGTVAVQPVCLAYSSPLAAWVGDEALVPHVWRVVRGEPMHCVVLLGTPIPYGVESDRKAVAVAAREAIVGLLAAERAVPSLRGGNAEPERGAVRSGCVEHAGGS